MSDMEWDEVDPIVKTVPWANAAISVNKDEKVRLSVSFSEPMMKDCKHPKGANVAIGVKDGKAMIRFAWTKEGEGKFEVRAMEKGGGRVHAIPIKDPIPDGARDGEACELVKKDEVEAIFILPLDAWKKQLDGPKPSAIAPVIQQKPAAPPVSRNKLEAVPYLRKKGVRISKLAGDWWMLDAFKVPRLDVLARINEIRRSENLPALGVDDIE